MFSSCRYVVCKGLKPGTDAVREYMFTINLKLNQFRDSDRDVTEVVPLDIIKGDTDFFQFMINSNERYQHHFLTLFFPSLCLWLPRCIHSCLGLFIELGSLVLQPLCGTDQSAG